MESAQKEKKDYLKYKDNQSMGKGQGRSDALFVMMVAACALCVMVAEEGREALEPKE